MQRDKGDDGTFPIVAVGASAGGLKAFKDLLQRLPRRPGMALVLIQHLDPGHESLLSDILGQSVGFQVTEARNGMAVEPDTVYVIPPGVVMIVKDGRLRLTPRRPPPTRNLPIDEFFASLAQERGARAIGVVLSGAASDGVRGLELIKAEGGITFAQDEKSAQFPELPRNAAAAGVVDYILPPREIAEELVRVSRHPYVARSAEPRSEDEDGSEDGLDRVLLLLRRARDVDFSRYKRATILRRVARRMALRRTDKYAQYLKILRARPEEVDALYEDLLIKVSASFRDPASFQALRAKVLPQLFKGRSESAPARIWVPGCSGGEEAYSIAITIMEYLGQQRASLPVQIFATDLSERAVERARAATRSPSPSATCA
jgi:two-component system CheB/CheR fusion protein